MAPAHILVIPKDRNGLTALRRATAEHTDILGRLLVAAGEITSNKTLGFGDDARIVIKDGPVGGQEVNHLHVHVLVSLVQFNAPETKEEEDDVAAPVAPPNDYANDDDANGEGATDAVEEAAAA
ncbi:hypothetical protein ACHAW5_006195 [Stephanodiscus triporus]|uniref:HIT domain-containing protein n=1 Tax=Stephanodiscus triporus TaxID=2934178 RepID=A0ABD3PFF5_9STRA